MATYEFIGYDPGSWIIEGGGSTVSVGSQVMLDPDWSASTDGTTFTITDDDTTFHGDANFDNIGDDSNQSGTATTSGGSSTSGRMYLRDKITFSDGSGTLVNVYTVYIGSTYVGTVADGPLTPGVTWEVTSIQAVTTTNDPSYSSLYSANYEQSADNDISGGAYNDTLHGGAGADTISAGSGADNVVEGGGGDDIIYGSVFADTLKGDDGNDTIWADSGDDVIYGGTGDDLLGGDLGNDTIYGEAGLDTLYGGAGTDYLDGGADADWIEGGTENDTILGGAGDDTIWGDEGEDSIDGGDGADLIYGNDGWDTIYGGTGADTISGGAGNDSMAGGSGDGDVFTFEGDWGNDTVFGDEWDGTGAASGDDTLDFSAIANSVSVTFTASEDGTATSGINSVTFDNIEAIVGGSAGDTIDASSDGSGLFLDGGGGADSITGGSGDDTIDGGAGNDTLSGGAGNDLIDGGTGADTITTGTGFDTVRVQDGSGADTVSDFDMSDVDLDGFTADQIDVSLLQDGTGGAITWSDVVVSDDGSGNALLSFPNGESLLLQGVAPSQVDSKYEMHSVGIPCYANGTMILTPRGEVPVETLRAGDRVVTLHHGIQPILWAGARALSSDDLAADPRMIPIRLRKGLFGNHSDLLVSPQHAMLLPDPGGGQRLVRAIHLLQLGDGRVRRAHGKTGVRYHHLLLPMHSVIFANGAPGESLFPGAFALGGFERAAKAELFSLFPALARVLSGADAQRLYGPLALPLARPRALRRLRDPLLPPRGDPRRWIGRLG